MKTLAEREEDEWTLACGRLTTREMFWVLVKVLAARGKLNVDELKDAVLAEAGTK